MHPQLRRDEQWKIMPAAELVVATSSSCSWVQSWRLIYASSKDRSKYISRHLYRESLRPGTEAYVGVFVAAMMFALVLDAMKSLLFRRLAVA